MRTAVLIPARGGSRGIPKKNLVDLCGRPLIAWSLKEAWSAKVGPIYVTTDDDEIATTAQWILPEIQVIREPPRDGTTTMEEVIRYALERMVKCEWLVLLQPTSPLRHSGDILNALSTAVGHCADSVVSVTETRKFLWEQDRGPEAHPVLHDKGLRVMRQDCHPRLAENGSIYVMRVAKFLEDGTRFCGRTVPYIMPAWTAQEIDELQDLDMVRLILADRLRQRRDGVRC